MSDKSNKFEYVILIVLLAAVIAFVWFFSRRQPYSHEPVVRSTLSSNVESLLVYYTLCGRLGLEVTRSRGILVEGGLSENVSVLFLISPRVSINDGELRFLRQWVGDGGVLVTTTDCDRLIDYVIDDDVSVDFDFHMPWQRERVDDGKSVTEVDRPQAPLARDVHSVCFSNDNMLDETAGGDALVTPLFSDSKGVRIVEAVVGRGRLIVLGDSSFMASGRIDQADNAILATNLASYAVWRAGGRQIAFDEYHFGYGGAQGGWRALMSVILNTTAGWAVLTVTVAGVLWMIYKGRQFGSRYTPYTGRRRSKMEFVESVGTVYEATGANRVTLRQIYRWFLRRCAASVALSENAAPGDIAARLAQRTGRSASSLNSVFDRCRKALEKKKISRGRFSAIIEALRKIEMEISYGYPKRKQDHTGRP